MYPCLGFVEPDTIFLVQSSFARIAERAEEFAPRFYANLFEVHPELHPLFRDDMAAQTKMFMYILSSAVRGLNRMQEMVGDCARWGSDTPVTGSSGLTTTRFQALSSGP